ncbi:hypothetical protein J1N35_036427 [Gossypium stocksii]|uniref:Uncharacterized protein n=1 Tax=Gossypium stocksii TaxID=47602 RepID=A0A9D3UI45_9ROSI|nr:hypothetical protein J1N35_036427 [Gossypium stocksii]
MATKAISGNDDENCQLFNTAARVDGSSLYPGIGFLRKTQQFSKHDTSVVDSNGNLVANPEFLFHKKQDKLLASWLLSTICDDILVHLTGTRSSFEV